MLGWLHAALLVLLLPRASNAMSPTALAWPDLSTTSGLSDTAGPQRALTLLPVRLLHVAQRQLLLDGNRGAQQLLGELAVVGSARAAIPQHLQETQSRGGLSWVVVRQEQQQEPACACMS